MWKWVWVALAGCASQQLRPAERWADEPVTPSYAAPVLPRVGPVVGVHLGVGPDSTEGPDVGVRGGVRVRLGPRTALSALLDATLVSASVLSRDAADRSLVGSRTQPVPYLAPRILGVARVEFISGGPGSGVLLPVFSVGAFVGAGVGFVSREWLVVTGETLVLVPVLDAVSGLHLAMTRLGPDGWWFPVFLDLGMSGVPGFSLTPYFSAGVGF